MYGVIKRDCGARPNHLKSQTGSNRSWGQGTALGHFNISAADNWRQGLNGDRLYLPERNCSMRTR